MRTQLAILLLLVTALTGCSRSAPPQSSQNATVAVAEPAFNGKIGKTIGDSEPDYLPTLHAPAGTPNVVIVLADDVGYADIAPYGSEIHTPNLQQLADHGLRYNDFTVDGVCSPTRAALLTGLNPHSAGVGWLAEWDMGYPGYRGEIHKNVATLPEILHDHGFATLMVGKWHLTLAGHRSVMGPYDSWPTRRGFDRYWGFLDGEASQWEPAQLISGTERVPTPYKPGFYLPDALTDHAVQMIRDLRAVSPDKPFFLYYASGAAHAPHHTKASDRARYRGDYGMGYDVIREQRLARQKELGIVPGNTRLAPRISEVKPWDSLTPDQKKMYARFQENYAAYVDNLDQNIGRLRDYLAKTGELDNTIFIFLSDNGASREVGVEGSANVLAYYHKHPLTTAQNLKYYDEIGSVKTHPHYPHGWMQASNTPFYYGKRTSWAGGVRVPFIISWPHGIHDDGQIRHQFHYVDDIVPTVLQLLHIKPPTVVDGRRVKPLEGVSMVNSFDHPDAPTTKKGQYIEVEAQRAYISDGWKIVSFREPDESYNAHPWHLYHLAEDFSETNDLADKYPKKVDELKAKWWADAQRYDVLPLVDMPLLQRAFRTRQKLPERHEWRIPRDAAPLPNVSAPTLVGISYTITAKLDRKAADHGVLVAQGDYYSGYTLYIQDNRLVYEYNVGYTRGRVVSDRELPTGPVTVEYRFDKVSTAGAVVKSLVSSGKVDGFKTLKGTGTLLIDGKPAGSLEVTIPPMAIWEGLQVGRDGLTPVSQHYQSPYAYTGKLDAVVYHFD